MYSTYYIIHDNYFSINMYNNCICYCYTTVFYISACLQRNILLTKVSLKWIKALQYFCMGNENILQDQCKSKFNKYLEIGGFDMAPIFWIYSMELGYCGSERSNLELFAFGGHLLQNCSVTFLYFCKNGTNELSKDGFDWIVLMVLFQGRKVQILTYFCH